MEPKKKKTKPDTCPNNGTYPTSGKCPSCGQKLSTSEFSLDVQEN